MAATLQVLVFMLLYGSFVGAAVDHMHRKCTTIDQDSHCDAVVYSSYDNTGISAIDAFRPSPHDVSITCYAEHVCNHHLVHIVWFIKMGDRKQETRQYSSSDSDLLRKNFGISLTSTCPEYNCQSTLTIPCQEALDKIQVSCGAYTEACPNTVKYTSDVITVHTKMKIPPRPPPSPVAPKRTPDVVTVHTRREEPVSSPVVPTCTPGRCQHTSCSVESSSVLFSYLLLLFWAVVASLLLLVLVMFRLTLLHEAARFLTSFFHCFVRTFQTLWLAIWEGVKILALLVINAVLTLYHVLIGFLSNVRDNLKWIVTALADCLLLWLTKIRSSGNKAGSEVVPDTRPPKKHEYKQADGILAAPIETVTPRRIIHRTWMTPDGKKNSDEVVKYM